METRNITIVSTRDQKRSVLSTSATTLSELKSALRTAGIDYDGMTFYEGLTHTELLTDESILPHDVPYRGETTNDLVIMLTNTNKKIKSGALSETRAALYSSILENHLENACFDKYGKNMTNCSNADLLAVIEEFEAENSDNDSDVVGKVVEAITALVGILEDNMYLDESDANEVLSILKGSVAKVEASKYSTDEISDMFAFLSV